MIQDLWNGGPSPYRLSDPATLQNEYSIAVAMLFGRQVGILKDDLKRSCPDDYSELVEQPMTFNLTRRVAEKRATLYREPVKFSGEVGDWPDLLAWGFWAAMGQADLISEVCNVCPVLVSWDTKMKAIVPAVVPPDQVRLRFHPFDSRRILEATITTYTEDAGGKPQKLRTVWTETEYHVYRGNSERDVAAEVAQESGWDYRGPEHGYNKVPILLVRPTSPIYGDPLGSPAESLVQANRTLNQKATELQLLLKMQSNSNLVLTGDASEKNGKVSTAVSRFIRFRTSPEGANPDAKWISPTPNADALLKTIMDTVRMVAFFHHLPGNFSLDATAAESGTALKIRNSDLSEYRRQKIEAHSLSWPDWADTLQRVAVVGAGKSSKDQSNVRAEFCDQETYESEEEVRAQLEWELKMFLTSPAQAYLETHPEFEPDLADEERIKLAQAQVDANAAAFRSTQARTASVAPPAQFTNNNQGA